MNIIESFSKLKENPNAVIKRGIITYKIKFGNIHFNDGSDDNFYKLDLDDLWFSFADIILDDWEVVE